MEELIEPQIVENHLISFDEITSKSYLDNETKVTEYSKILHSIQSQSITGLQSIKKRIDFLLKEQSVTFTRTTSKQEGSWDLDIIPHIITEKEFEYIESGCKQRILALNALLNDIYSKGNEARILKEKIIPLPVILGDENYLRNCVGVSVPQNMYLHVCAFDLIRSPDGTYKAIDDNVTIPSGIGYSIINRQVLRQQYPDIFQNIQLHSVMDVISTMLSRFRECAPTSVNDPRVVLLSPGIYNEAFTEHEFLANKMGIPLVLPKDLIVKDNHVFMRTVNGFDPVDIIYRRIQDFYIDPVSFFQDSVLGVPGLMSSVRAGNVSVLNAIGCGVASSKGLLPYTDKIIRFYLDEEPIIQTAQTHLLYENSLIDSVFQNISKYVIKPIQGSGGRGILIGQESSKKAIQEFKSKVISNPYKFIAQELIPLSKSLVFDGNNLDKRFVESRIYCFSGKTISVSTAALTRVSPRLDTLMVCNSMGGGSKDTWVLKENKEISPIIYKISQKYFHNKTHILSRVAENLFWLGRYVNRILSTANLFLVTYSSEIDQLLGKKDPAYKNILKAMVKLSGSSESVIQKSEDPWQIAFYDHAIADSKNSSSMVSNIGYVMNNAREIQNYLPTDMWISLRKIYEKLRVIPKVNKVDDAKMEYFILWLESILHYSQSFYGFSRDTFSRQEVLQYIELGRHIEHSYSILSVVQTTLQFLYGFRKTTNVYNNLQPFIIILLKILNSYEAFQWNYQLSFQPYIAYRMLIYDKDFNMSLVNCLSRIKTLCISDHLEPTQNPDTTPEYLCDLLISMTYSLNLKKLTDDFSDGKLDSITLDTITGQKNIPINVWADSMIRGLNLLSIKIMDKYNRGKNQHDPF